MREKGRFRRELAVRVGSVLLKEQRNRGFLKVLAEGLEVTPQTLRNWKRLAAMEEKPQTGRPRYSQEKVLEAESLVRMELERQGYPGWRPVAKAIPWLPVRLVQSSVAKIKRERRIHIRKKLSSSRTNTKVLVREAVWTIDGTQTKGAEGKKYNQVIKDRGSLAYRAVMAGDPARADDVVSLLSAMPNLPLVIASDNDKIYCGEKTAEWLRRRQVVHLKSLPRTPQHNGAIEVSIRALKEAAEHRGASLATTANQINTYRLLGSKGYKTPTVLDAELPVAYHKVNRAVFYEKCMVRLRRVAEAPMKWREKRLAEREVIYATLEEYGLIKRSGGEGSWCRQNAKIFL